MPQNLRKKRHRFTDINNIILLFLKPTVTITIILITNVTLSTESSTISVDGQVLLTFTDTDANRIAAAVKETR